MAPLRALLARSSLPWSPSSINALYDTAQHRDSTTTTANVPSSLIPAIVLTALISTIMVLVSGYTLHRVWTKAVLPRLESRRSKNAADNTTAENTDEQLGTGSRRNSDWARKDSNVLFAMHIDEEDLSAQFSSFAGCPSAWEKASARMFSIGTVGSEAECDQGTCPLDTRGSAPGQENTVEKKDSNTATHALANGNGAERSIGTASLRNRTGFEHGTTPTKTLPARSSRAMSSPSRVEKAGKAHKFSNSFDAAERRRMKSVAAEDHLSLEASRKNDGVGMSACTRLGNVTEAC